MPTTTTTYSFNKPVVGADEDSWGGYLNGNWDSVDDLLDGTTPITGIDINSGTLDGVTIGGTTAGAGTFTTLTANTSITGTLATAAQPNVTSLGTLTSLTVSGNLSFGDSDKAIFGAGSDLSIYHDETTNHSYIIESGTGDLRVLASTFNVRNVANTENMLVATPNGSVDLYYDNAEKLSTTSTGVDITGNLLVTGNAEAIVNIQGTTAGGSFVNFGDNTDANVGQIGYDHTSNYMRFKTNDTERMRITSSGSVGIGTSSPSAKLNVIGSGRFDNSAATPVRLHINNSGSNDYASIYADTTSAYKNLVLNPNGGNVGIGTSSPSTVLHINDATDPILRLQRGGAAYSQFSSDSSGSLFIRADEGNTGASSRMQFDVDGSEAARIDSSGNLLVGTTNSAPVTSGNVNGISLQATGGNFQVNRASGVAAYFGRKTNDGDIVQFRKDGTTVGSIGSYVGNLYIGSPNGTDAFMRFGNSHITPSTSGGSFRDAAIDLGQSGGRFKDLYLSGGVYLGGTGSANKLDDYEEGTFTPVVADAASGGNEGSATDAYGYYTKTGRQVTVQITLLNIDTTGLTGANDLYITGVPFAAEGLSGINYFTGSMSAALLTTSADVVVPEILDSSSYVRIREWGLSGTGTDWIIVSELTSGSADLNITLTYFAT